jgi:hypothetical protein
MNNAVAPVNRNQRAKFLVLAVIAVVVAAPALAEETCVEVEIGGEKTPNLSCLNRLLRKQADNAHPTGNVAPLDATSPSVSLGGYSETALKQQYGPNYGKSVVPYRPPAAYGTPPH